MAAPTSSPLLPLLGFLLAGRASGLYDPVRHVESCRIYGNIHAYAYYYIDLLVGTPPQRVSVILDTGSGVCAFPCASCPHCGQHIDANFDFAQSSSAKWVECGGACHGQCKSGHCSYYQGYTEGSSVSGYWFNDFVRMGDAIQHNPAVISRMGCHQNENKLFFTQKANGILGVAPQGRFGGKTLLQDIFSHREQVDHTVFAICLAEWGGRLVVGGANETYHTGPVQWIPMRATGFYNVGLSGMRVNGQRMQGSFGTAMIDIGTTYTYMASQPYRSLKSAIETYCTAHGGCGAAKVSLTCWDVPEGGLSRFPDVDVLFGEVSTAWKPKAYMYRKGTGRKWCYTFEDDGRKANTVLGASWMLHQEIIFDLSRQKVGIAPAACPEFHERPVHSKDLDISVPTVPPPTAAAPATTRALNRRPS
jgi:hypothetical protein